mmetsp:Transcript_542/g.948  ORF Transcript_542/g.948 Transcript_542/m.948 type:complete len:310 (-) Transcript_542:236-1165(-)
MSWDDVQAALEACAGLEAFLPQFSPPSSRIKNVTNLLATTEQSSQPLCPDDEKGKSHLSPARPERSSPDRLKVDAGMPGADDNARADVWPNTEQDRGCMPEHHDGADAGSLVDTVVRPVMKSDLISSLRVLLKEGLPSACNSREWDAVVSVGKQLGIIDWGVVFDEPLALKLPDPLPMPPRAPALSAEELGKLVGHLATPTCGLFALCHALPIFCAAKTAAQLTEVADGLDVDFVNSVWESFASKDLTGLAMDAYLAASLEELPKERFTQLLRASRLRETGRAGQLVLQQLSIAYYGDNKVAIDEFWLP